MGASVLLKTTEIYTHGRWDLPRIRSPLDDFTLKEGNAKKPIYRMHKWWARRLGSAFRMLMLATFAEDDIHPMELWRRFYTRNQLTVEGDGKRVPEVDLAMAEALASGGHVV